MNLSSILLSKIHSKKKTSKKDSKDKQLQNQSGFFSLVRGLASTLSNEGAFDSSSETSFKSTMDNQPILSDPEEEGPQEINPLDYIYADSRPTDYGAAGFSAQYSAQPPVRPKGRGFNPNYNLSAGRPNMNQRQAYQPPEYKDFSQWVMEASSMMPADAIAGNSNNSRVSREPDQCH